jgi:hypothetical protein
MEVNRIVFIAGIYIHIYIYNSSGGHWSGEGVQRGEGDTKSYRIQIIKPSPAQKQKERKDKPSSGNMKTITQTHLQQYAHN